VLDVHFCVFATTLLRDDDLIIWKALGHDSASNFKRFVHVIIFTDHALRVFFFKGECWSRMTWIFSQSGYPRHVFLLFFHFHKYIFTHGQGFAVSVELQVLIDQRVNLCAIDLFPFDLFLN